MTKPLIFPFSQFGFLLYLLGVKLESVWDTNNIKVDTIRAQCPYHFLKVQNMISCVDVCLSYTDCEAVNYGTNNQNCELFVKDGEVDLDTKKNRLYIDMGIAKKIVSRNPCYSRPCGNGTRCIPGGRSYICVKPDPCTSFYLIYGKCGVPVSNIIVSSGVIPSNFNLEFGNEWCAAKQQIGEWILVKFRIKRVVKEVVTRGARLGHYWVESFTLEYSLDCEHFKYVMNSTNKIQEFEGNTDKTTYKYNVIQYRFKASCVRIRPLSWHRKMCMKFDLIGCKPWN